MPELARERIEFAVKAAQLEHAARMQRHRNPISRLGQQRDLSVAGRQEQIVADPLRFGVVTRLEGSHHPTLYDDVRREKRRLSAIDDNIAGTRSKTSRYDVDQRRLAGTVRPDQAVQLSRLDLEIEFV